MKVFLLGSTGRLGNEILKNLIARKIYTTVLIRNQEKIKWDSEYLDVFVGNPLEIDKLDEAMSNCNIIINALNISRNSDFPWSKLRAPKTLLSETISNLINLSKKHNFYKIISVSAWGVNESKKQLPLWFRWLIDNSNIKHGYLDHEKQEQILTSSNLDYTIIRPVGLSNSQKDESPKITIKSKPGNILVSRKTISKFIVDNLEKYNKETVTIS
tara:strand:+ start:1281 stop:1922 length:642 start_codon:yes stop_codon:yes gene_type:complete